MDPELLQDVEPPLQVPFVAVRPADPGVPMGDGDHQMNFGQGLALS